MKSAPFVGLHRALLFHAREVVAPLFKVRDDATADLERFFYRAYAEGSDAVAALATAQRAFLVSESGRGEPDHLPLHLCRAHRGVCARRGHGPAGESNGRSDIRPGVLV